MQILDDGKHLLVHSNGIKAFNSLPMENNYSVEWENPMSGVGFYLSRTKLFEAPTFKTYGNQLSMVDDVINSFKASDKSVGVILSGDKGTGKTIFSKLLSIKARELGMPTILVNNSTEGVTNFLARIDKSAVMMFDEFEKKFNDNLSNNDPNNDSQNDLLSLFDGVMGGKNIYVLTVNDLVELSPFLLNRPGRFMYAIRMEEPTPEDIKQYLEDKLNKKVVNREKQIKEIIQFSFKFPLSYDILDTLTFQLNLGNEFKKVLPTLNLMNFSDTDYNINVEFESGYIFPLVDVNINLFSEVIKVTSSESIDFDFLSKDLEVAENCLKVSGDNINRVHVYDSLKDKVQSGLKPEPIKEISITPNRKDDFSFNI